MAENKTRRMCFNLNGLMGGLLATFLLLGILVYLTMWGIQVQRDNATKFYQLQDETNIQMKSTDNIKHRVYK